MLIEKSSMKFCEHRLGCVFSAFSLCIEESIWARHMYILFWEMKVRLWLQNGLAAQNEALIDYCVYAIPTLNIPLASLPTIVITFKSFG